MESSLNNLSNNLKELEGKYLIEREFVSELEEELKEKALDISKLQQQVSKLLEQLEQQTRVVLQEIAEGPSESAKAAQHRVESLMEENRKLQLKIEEIQRSEADDLRCCVEKESNADENVDQDLAKKLFVSEIERETLLAASAEMRSSLDSLEIELYGEYSKYSAFSMFMFYNLNMFLFTCDLRNLIRSFFLEKTASNNILQATIETLSNELRVLENNCETDRRLLSELQGELRAKTEEISCLQEASERQRVEVQKQTTKADEASLAAQNCIERLKEEQKMLASQVSEIQRSNLELTEIVKVLRSEKLELESSLASYEIHVRDLELAISEREQEKSGKGLLLFPCIVIVIHKLPLFIQVKKQKWRVFRHR